jgi:hypothetical protein
MCNKPVVTGALHDPGKFLATQFFEEVLQVHETLTGIADEKGPRTLADLMYLQSAILKGTYVDFYPGESGLMDVVKALPGAETWTQFIRVEGQCGRGDACCGTCKPEAKPMRYVLVVGRIPDDENTAHVFRVAEAVHALKLFEDAVYADETDAAAKRESTEALHGMAVFVDGVFESASPITTADVQPDIGGFHLIPAGPFKVRIANGDYWAEDGVPMAFASAKATVAAVDAFIADTVAAAGRGDLDQGYAATDIEIIDVGGRVLAVDEVRAAA